MVAVCHVIFTLLDYWFQKETKKEFLFLNVSKEMFEILEWRQGSDQVTTQHTRIYSYNNNQGEITIPWQSLIEKRKEIYTNILQFTLNISIKYQMAQPIYTQAEVALHKEQDFTADKYFLGT